MAFSLDITHSTNND